MTLQADRLHVNGFHIPDMIAAQFNRLGSQHVIGFKVRGEHFDWAKPDDPEATTVARCLADETGGKYVRAETVDELIGALQVTLGCTVMGSLRGQSVVRLR